MLKQVTFTRSLKTSSAHLPVALHRSWGPRRTYCTVPGPVKKEQTTPQKVEPSKTLARRRKPTVEEEIKYTKRYDLKVCFTQPAPIDCRTKPVFEIPSDKIPEAFLLDVGCDFGKDCVRRLLQQFATKVWAIPLKLLTFSGFITIRNCR